jgi:hypothetical protein
MMEQLLLDLFDSRPNVLSAPFEQWMTTSKPFMVFAQKYQRKIRKKVGMSRDHDETYNLYCELRTAYILLQEPKFAIAYEPYSKEHGRSADFAVTFRTHTGFHVEVTRLRVSQQEQLYRSEHANGEADLEKQVDFLWRYESRRLVDVVCDKFAQLSPTTANILWIWSDSKVILELDVGQIMLDLKRRVEQKDSQLFSRYRFGKPADFFRYFQRLSGILVQSLYEQTSAGSLLWWQNNDARYSLPSTIENRLRSLITGDNSLSFPVEN